MISYTTFIFCFAVAAVSSTPVNNNQLDKATVNDVAVNSVSEENKVEVVAEIKPATAVSAPPTSSVQITGITAGSSSSSALPNQDDPTPFKPQRVGSMFARFIDDIFQIPINVLQNVARLITSPFNTQKKDPQVVATVSQT